MLTYAGDEGPQWTRPVALPAVDAWQAVDQLQQYDIDLIILDLRMPGPVDGEQLLFALGDQGNEVPVIVLSGWVDGEVRISSPACVHTHRVEETDQGGQFP